LGRVKRAFWRVATATATSRFYYEASLSGKWHTVAADLRGNFLIVGDERYQLTQFHFHRPSEEYIHGKPYDMGVPLMHKSSDGKVAGVAVLLQAASANATIQQLWQPMPMSEGKEQKSRRAGEQEIAGVDIHPAGLLPRDAAYYLYMGSLTAPPCAGALPGLC
jgi:carbonic anhydrase